MNVQAHKLHPAMAQWLTIDPATEARLTEPDPVVEESVAESAAAEVHPFWNGSMPQAGPEVQQAPAAGQAHYGAPVGDAAQPQMRADGTILMTGGHFVNPPSTDIGQPQNMNEVGLAAKNLVDSVDGWLNAGQQAKQAAYERRDASACGMAPQEYKCVGDTLMGTINGLKALSDQCVAIYKTDPEKAGPHAQVLLDYISQAGREFVKRFQGFNALVQNDANAQSYRSQAAIYSAQSNNAMNMSFMYQQEGRQGADMYAMERGDERGGRGGFMGGGMGCGPMGPMGYNGVGYNGMFGNMGYNPLMYQNGGAWPGAVGATGLPFTPGVMPGVVPTPPVPPATTSPQGTTTADFLFADRKITQ